MTVDAHHAIDLRTRIVAAAAQVVREQGVAGTRTSAIAEAAGCAEGSIYRYFPSKHELLCEVVRSQLPRVDPLLRALPARAGLTSVDANLRIGAQSALAYYAALVPLAVGVLGDPHLLAEHRDRLDCGDLGAHGPLEPLAAYVRAEQALGRVDGRVDADHAARTIADACLGATVAAFLGGADADGNGDAAELVELVTEGLDPR